MMLDTERLKVYLQSLSRQENTSLLAIKERAIEEQIPIIRDEMADLLMFLMRLLKPARVLEVGCAVGYSTLWMREYLPADTRITTMEMDQSRADRARANFEKLGADNIELIVGDATEILAGLADESYDLIFMDAAKAQYLIWLPEVRRILVKGGVLITDNVLFDGDVLQSRYAVERRDRTIHGRMRDYLFALKNTEGLTTTIVNVGDGAALTLKE